MSIDSRPRIMTFLTSDFFDNSYCLKWGYSWEKDFFLQHIQLFFIKNSKKICQIFYITKLEKPLDLSNSKRKGFVDLGMGKE
jgi:hypothetical protein